MGRDLEGKRYKEKLGNKENKEWHWLILGQWTGENWVKPKS